MSMKRGSPIKILIVLLVIGLLLVPVVSAGTVYQSFKTDFSLGQFNVVHHLTGSQQYSHIVYDAHLTAGDFSIPFVDKDPYNDPVCGSCGSPIHYSSGKNLVLNLSKNFGF